MTELQSNGQNAQSGQFLIDDVFNQEISGDSIRFDNSGNLMYGDKMFLNILTQGFLIKINTKHWISLQTLYTN